MADCAVRCYELDGIPYTTGGLMQQPSEWVRLMSDLNFYKGGRSMSVLKDLVS